MCIIVRLYSLNNEVIHCNQVKEIAGSEARVILKGGIAEYAGFEVNY